MVFKPIVADSRNSLSSAAEKEVRHESNIVLLLFSRNVCMVQKNISGNPQKRKQEQEKLDGEVTAIGLALAQLETKCVALARWEEQERSPLS